MRAKLTRTKQMIISMKMKKIQYHFAIAAAAFGLTMSSCSESFLDKLPDERTEIDSEDKVIDLLKSAYPSANYSWIAELSSDNVIDNSTPHYPTNPNDKQILAHYNYSSYDRWDDQLYKFEPATMATYSDYDSPGSLWGGYYEAIATVNHALQAIDEIEAKSGMTKKLKAAKAEALLIRAYCHFCLVNVFAQAYKDDACTQFDHYVDASHIYIAGFWTTGSAPIYIKDVFLSNDGVNPTGISEYEWSRFEDAPHDGVTLSKKEYYTLDGCKLDGPQPGLNIVKVTENNGKARIFKVCYKR